MEDLMLIPNLTRKEYSKSLLFLLMEEKSVTELLLLLFLLSITQIDIPKEFHPIIKKTEQHTFKWYY